MLLRFRLAILAALRLCRGDRPALGSPPGGLGSVLFSAGAFVSALQGGASEDEVGPTLLPSDPSLAVSVDCVVASVCDALSPRLRWCPRWKER